jgi:hypothetical protein
MIGLAGPSEHQALRKRRQLGDIHRNPSNPSRHQISHLHNRVSNSSLFAEA